MLYLVPATTPESVFDHSFELHQQFTSMLRASLRPRNWKASQLRRLVRAYCNQRRTFRAFTKWLKPQPDPIWSDKEHQDAIYGRKSETEFIMDLTAPFSHHV